MLDKNYVKVESIVNDARYKLSKLLDSCTSEGVENREAYWSIENLISKLEDVENELQYLNKPVKEGKLIEDKECGKFYIAYKDGSESYLLGCGNSIEVYLQRDLEGDVEEGWHIGRVEHTSRDGQSGYYFYGANKPFLYSGMVVRKRID